MLALSVYLATAVVFLTIAVYFKFLYRKRRPGEPPIVPGSLFFGNAGDFNKHAVQFLHNCRKRCGDIFTLRLLNQHMTIVMDPHSFENFAVERNFDFDVIQKQVNHNVFSFELADAKRMLKEAGKTVKGKFLHRGMKLYSAHLQDAYNHISHVDMNRNTLVAKDNVWHESELREMTCETLFTALFYTIFGKGKEHDVFKPLTVFRNFNQFHKYFNFLWLGFPVRMFPKAFKALQVLCQQPTSDEYLRREDISDYIRFSTEFMLNHNQTEQDIIGHNLVYLHVNYNTFRMACWAVYHLLEKTEGLHALTEEIHEAVLNKIEEMGGIEEGESVPFNLEEVSSLPILDSVVNETLRISSGVFMVRGIVEDTEFEMEDGSKFNLRKGDKVAVYPPALHRDPDIYESPDEYKYDRFVDAKFYKYGKEVKHPLLAFGSLCPGKKYATTQAKWFLMTLVHMFDMELLPGESTKEDTRYYGHEILPPVNDVQMRYRLKNQFHQLTFV